MWCFSNNASNCKKSIILHLFNLLQNFYFLVDINYITVIKMRSSKWFKYCKKIMSWEFISNTPIILQYLCLLSNFSLWCAEENLLFHYGTFHMVCTYILKREVMCLNARVRRLLKNGGIQRLVGGIKNEGSRKIGYVLWFLDASGN